MHLPTPLSPVKTPLKGFSKLVPILAVLIWVAFGLGYFVGVASAYRVKVPIEAYKLARVNVENEMREACSPWFTDRRGQSTDKRIVACKAPEFMMRVSP